MSPISRIEVRSSVADVLRSKVVGVSVKQLKLKVNSEGKVESDSKLKFGGTELLGS